MTEVTLFHHIKNALPKVHWQRIENAVGVGAFDVNGCFSGKEFWIELKVFDAKPELRFTQYAWGNRREREGGRIFLLAFKNRNNSLYLYKPPFVIQADMFETCENVKFPIENNPIAVFSKPWDFEKLLKEHLIK